MKKFVFVTRSLLTRVTACTLPRSSTSLQKHVLQRFSTTKAALPNSTIDSEEAIKFQKFASQWWNPNGNLGPLHAMNQLRVPLIRDGLCSLRKGTVTSDDSKVTNDFAPLSGFSILDVGCGGGILTEPLAYLGAQVLGIDEVAESIQVATTHAELTSDRWDQAKRTCPRYEVVGLDAVAARSPSNFDAVVMSEVLEHVTDWEGMLQLAAACLKPGGMLFLTTINQTYASLLFGIWAAEYLVGLVPRGTHEWRKFIDPSRLQGALIRNGFQPHQLLGMVYNPLTGRWSWTGNLAINYAITAVKTGHNPSAEPTSTSSIQGSE